MLEESARYQAREAVVDFQEVSIALNYSQNELKRLVEFVQTFACIAQLPKETLEALDLTLTEWLTNIISYACPEPGSDPIAVRLHRIKSGVRVEVEDSGKPFNPLEYPDVNIHLPLKEKPIGGLGIHLMRQLMDQIEYERAGHKNRLRMFKQIAKTDVG